MAFKLTIAKGYEQGKEVVLHKDEATIGRTEDNDFVLTEIGVSRRHLRIFTRGGKHLAEDPGNHRTLLNDQPLTAPRELKSGDLLALGPVVLRYEALPPAPSHRDAPPIDRGETRVAPPEPGEAPDLHRMPTAPMSGGRPVRDFVPIDRAPTAALPPEPGSHPIDRDPTDPARQAADADASKGPAPVLPPLPAALISRLRHDGEASSPRASPALTPHDTPHFTAPPALTPAETPAEARTPILEARPPAFDAYAPPTEVRPETRSPPPLAGSRPPLYEPYSPATELRSPAEARAAMLPVPPPARLGDSNAPRSSGQKSRLPVDLASLPAPSPRVSGPKASLNAPAPQRSGAKPALPASVAGVLDDSIRPATFPEDDRPTQARPEPFRPARRGLGARHLAAGVAVVAVLVVAVLAVRWMVRRNHPDLGPTALDSERIAESFGVGPDVRYRVGDFKQFEVDARPEPRVVAVLHLTAANMTAGELQVRLNGTELPHRVGEVTAGQNDAELVLPREALRRDGNNLVELRRNPRADLDSRWQVSNLWVERVALPDGPDEVLIETALKFAARGRDYLDRSASAPDSLFQAWKAYRSAWLTVEPLRPHPPLHDEALAKYEAIGRTLDERCLALVSAAERSLQGRDARGARDSLDQVSRYFPSGEHRCHNLAVELLSQHGL